MIPSAAPGIDAAASHTILLIVLYLIAALGGVLAFVYRARFAPLGLAIAFAAGILALVTAMQLPPFVPVVLVGLACTAMAGRSIARERLDR